LAAWRLTRAEICAWAAAALLIAVLPYLLSRFQAVQATVLMIYAILALSLDLIWGIAGVLSFGQAALFGIGGYVYGVVGINSGWTTLALLAGMVGPALVATLIGYAAFYGRVGSMYFAVITLTVTLILHQVMGSTADPKYAIGAARLGGYNGMTNIPSLAIDLAGPGGIELGITGMFYAVGALLLSALAGCVLIVRSSFGRVLQGIRENELRTELLGFDVRWRKVVAFALAGAMAGLAGALFAAWSNFINPEVFSLPQAAVVVIWVLVGGRGTLYGAVLGAILVQYLTSYFGVIGASYTTVLLGGVLVAIVLVFPEGLVPVVGRQLDSGIRLLSRLPSRLR
jgi:branched-chain amino acid transport system permease protein